MLFLRLSPLQLSPPSSTSAYSTPRLLTRLSSAHAWGPQPAGLTWSFSLPGASRQTCLAAASWYGRPGPPDLALLDLPRAGRALRAPFHGKRHLHAAQWTQPSLGSTGEPPVIDLLKSWPPLGRSHLCDLCAGCSSHPAALFHGLCQRCFHCFSKLFLFR